MNDRRQRWKRLAGKLACSLCLTLLLACPAVRAQPDTRRYSFVKHELNVINDVDSSLNSLFHSLYLLQRRGNDSLVVPILHVGDSHLQAGFISGILRPSLQRQFGNAGRGLIVPYRMAGTNEPKGYSIRGVGNFTGARCVIKKHPFRHGLSGIAVETCDPAFSIYLETKLDTAYSLNYAFNRITVFHDSISALQPDSLETSFLKTDIDFNTYTLQLNKSVDTLWLHHASPDSLPKTLHAFSLENGRAGIIYHMVGVNGAMFQSYCDIPLFFAQSRELAPRLIILSLGTNESFDGSFSKADFLSQVDCVVRWLRTANPDAVFLLTTPAEDYRRYQRKRIPNNRIGLVRDALVDYAVDNSVAYWDLYSATGGKNSCQQWRKAGLMGKDQIHYNVQGYELQGQLLYEALMNRYNAYVEQHGLE